MKYVYLLSYKILFFILDFILIKRNDYWMFPCHYIQIDTFKDNPRALFEYVKKKPEIKKIIVYRSKKFKNNIENAVNTEIVKHGTLRFFYLLARSKVVFLSNSISLDYSFRFNDNGFSVLQINSKKRFVVNLWHGIPLKKLYYTANKDIKDRLDRLGYRRRERAGYAGLVCSSNIDSYAMAASFYPLNYKKMWITGLPRNDFLKMPKDELPCYIQESLADLELRIKGRKLVVYAPTYRQVDAVSEARYYQFSNEEINRLKEVLIKNNAILGYRPHYFKNSDQYFNFSEFIDNNLIVDLSVNVIDDFAVIARKLDVLITDYSSVYMDALYLDKPVIGFTYDLESYQSEQDGLLYTLDQAFPGATYSSFNDLTIGLDKILTGNNNFDSSKIKNLFYMYDDYDNCKRVCDEVLKKIENLRN